MTCVLFLKAVDSRLKYLSNLKLIRRQQFFTQLFAKVKLASSLVTLNIGLTKRRLALEADLSGYVAPETLHSDRLLVT